MWDQFTAISRAFSPVVSEVGAEVQLGSWGKGGEMDQDRVISSASCSRTTRVATASSDDFCPGNRELAVRGSNGTQVRLLWRQGTRQLWVEVWEPGTAWVLRIQAQPEKALDVFHHPYAYAGLDEKCNGQ